VTWIAALAGGLLIAVVVTPLAIRLAARLGVAAPPNPDVPTHTCAVPLLGGLALAAAILPWLAVAAADDHRWIGVPVAVVLVIGLGAYKDRVVRDVHPGVQLAVEAIAAGLAWWGGLRLGHGLASWLDASLAIGLTLVIVNAWNFLDVMDGLAGGVAATAGLAYLAIGLASADPWIAVVGGALAGGALGYLPFNWPPARIFMGDIGSLTIGLTTATLSITAIARDRLGPIALAPLCVPLGDLAFTTALRLALGRSPLRGGDEHATLRLAARGWSTRRVVLVACAITATAGLAAGLAAHLHRSGSAAVTASVT